MDTSTTLPAAALPSIETAPPATPATSDATAARKTAEDFEGFFLSQVFENMFAGIGPDSMFGGGNSESIYRSLLLQEYSKVAAKSDNIGIADAVQREILRGQETQ
jgi:Rod binding domain-containing protein